MLALKPGLAVRRIKICCVKAVGWAEKTWTSPQTAVPHTMFFSSHSRSEADCGNNESKTFSCCLPANSHSPLAVLVVDGFGPAFHIHCNWTLVPTQIIHTKTAAFAHGPSVRCLESHCAPMLSVWFWKGPTRRRELLPREFLASGAGGPPCQASTFRVIFREFVARSPYRLRHVYVI